MLTVPKVWPCHAYKPSDLPLAKYVVNVTDSSACCAQRAAAPSNTQASATGLLLIITFFMLRCAMLCCAACLYRNADFLSNVISEVTQQLLRLGSHASLVVFGGNNEVEQSIEWYNETCGDLAMYATDYSALFVDTVGTLVQKVRNFNHLT